MVFEEAGTPIERPASSAPTSANRSDAGRRRGPARDTFADGGGPNVPEAAQPIEGGDGTVDSSMPGTLTDAGLRGRPADSSSLAGHGYGAPGQGPRFRILRPHARGGLGDVFVAFDAELHREVALKSIRPDRADHPRSRTRFLLEAEVTGGLEHPGIIPVYGLGHDHDGRPFYAMRLIKGDNLKVAIAQFHQVDGARRDPGERALALRQLLRRFLDVCNALAYAHSRGVLHRDVKPGNILLGPYGETLVVDWGLAKALDRTDVLERTSEPPLRPTSGSVSNLTQTGSALGTPAFMSPEQAAGQLDQVGPASDVYSLGATLYCLLTGHAPIQDLDAETVLRKVRDGEFPPPRQVHRGVAPALEAICLKAMARDPADRYPSPLALAEDVEHWLADEPVSAHRDPFSRRARRWMQRNRTAAAAAVVAMVAGVVGLGAVAGVQARANGGLRKANEATNRALAETTKAQAETRAALAQSEESRQQAEGVSEFLVEAFRSPDPAQTGREVKVADVLDRASAKLDKGFAGSQATKGALLDALGRTYRGLGLYDRAVSLHTKARAVRETALGPDHPDTLASRHNLATAYQEAGRMSEAIALHEGTLKLRESKLGPDHDHTLKSRNNLANAYWSAGRIAEAIALHEGTLKLRESKLGPDHPDTLNSRHNLALTYWSAGRIAEAIALHEATLKLRESKLGPDHLDTLNSRHNLAVAYRSVGRIVEAIALHEATLKLREAKLGPDHPDTLTSRNNLAVAYAQVGRLPEAIASHEANLQLMESKLGPDHPVTLQGRTSLANDYQAAGRTAEATALHQRTLELREAKLGPDHLETLASRHNLASAYLEAGRMSEAIPLHEATLKRMEAKLGADHPYTLASRTNLAAAYESLGRWAEAERMTARRAGPPPQERPA